MSIKKLLLTAAAAAVLSTAGAGMAAADPYDHRGPMVRHEMRMDHRMDRREVRHDRYWREEYRDRHFVDRDRVYGELRRHHFNRFVGEPYWYHDRYVVRSYDRFGHIVFVEVNPYTGAFIGTVRF